MMWLCIIIGVLLVAAIAWLVHRQRSLKLRAHLMQEAIRNRDFTFRLPTDGLLPGERAMQQTLNQLGETIRQQVNQNEVEAWERLTRVLTHDCDTSRHLSDFVANYRKMSELEKPVLADLPLLPLLDNISKAYPELTWEVSVPRDTTVCQFLLRTASRSSFLSLPRSAAIAASDCP